MEPIALTRASQLIQVTDTLERLGVSPQRTLRQAKLPMWHYCDPEDLIPANHIYALMDQAARNLGSPTFGLRVGADTSIATLGAFGKLVDNSISTYHAFQTICRFIHLHSSAGRYRLAEAGDTVWCCRSALHGPKTGQRENEQYILMRMIDLVCEGAGSSWRPAKVCLQTKQAPQRELREALGDPEIRVGRRFTGIAIPRELLARPRRRVRAQGEITAAEERRLRRTVPALNFVDTLRQLAATLLKEGHPKVETIAEIAGLSVRSLQRRLAREGLSHSEIVEQARYQAATRLLEDTDNRVTDIGFELGYSDSAHFTRAFKRWAGVTPREYRAHQFA